MTILCVSEAEPSKLTDSIQVQLQLMK